MFQIVTKCFGVATLFALGQLICGPVQAVPVDELQRRLAYQAELIAVEGFVIDSTGAPVVAALVELSFLPAQITATSATTDESGYYRLNGVARRNAQLRISATGYRTELNYLQLVVPQTHSAVLAEPVVLSAADAAERRALFGGDLTWGRRLLGLSGTVSEQSAIDASGVFPPDDLRAAQIDIADPVPGTEATIAYIQPYFAQADFRSVVLHTPSLAASPAAPPTNRHPTREFAYFNMAESMPTLNSLGVDYVALGNDHIYDYLEPALDQTLDQLDGLGLSYSGAASQARAAAAGELVEDQAYAPHRAAAGLSLMSFTSLGFNAMPSYVASDLDGKGGAAYAGLAASYGNKFRNAVFEEAVTNDNPTVVQLHMGFSNSFEPSDSMLIRARNAVDNGAALVVGHHAHIVHGFEYIVRPDPAAPPALAVHGLGNLIYDQTRLETATGLLAQVDLANDTVRRARVLPIYLKGFVPRPAVGALAESTLRQAAGLSIGAFPQSAGQAAVTQLNSTGWVLPDAATLDSQPQPPVEFNVALDGDGRAVVDLRDLTGSPALLELDPSLELKAGSDLLRFGDFEDFDVDEETFELEQWTADDAVIYACLEQPRGGVFAACIDVNSAGQAQTLANRNALRVRLQFIAGQDPVPMTDLSVLGYLRAASAGPIDISVTYRASRSRECAGAAFQFGQQTILTEPALNNNFGWTRFEQALVWPADPTPAQPQLRPGECMDETGLEYDWEFDTPRALKLELTQQPGSTALGRAAFDRLAVISWTALANNGAVALPTPNPTQFLHLTGPPNANVNVTVTTQQPKPAIAVGLIPELLFSDGFEGP